MTYPIFGFTGQTGQDPSAQAGLQQYATQGQMGINPGQAQVAASSPIAFAGQKGLAQALAQQPQPLPSQQNIPSVGPNAPMGNLPIAPRQYQSQAALENATGPLYPSPYAAQQAQPWLSRVADYLTGGGAGGGQ